MATDFFSAHKDTLERALQATASREYWTPFPEMPSPRVYGEEAAAQGHLMALTLMCVTRR